jgi:glycosyltransferase involved in cell wall biosynthesis
MPKTKYSVVIPVYNSMKVISQVIERTTTFFERNGWLYEMILVNDGSPDKSWEVISRYALANQNITAINLMRNYGQHTAVYCGFKHASGDYLITLDDDLQNPPEEILHLVNALTDGHDVVFGQFREKRHTQVRNIGSFIIRMINNRIFKCPPHIAPTNFRLIRRDVVDRILGYRTSYPYITGLVLMFSSNPGNVQVEHQKRLEGKSNYTLYKILSLVSRILFNYSVWPLRLVSLVGIAISVLSFLGGIILIINKLLNNVAVEGWTGLMVLLAFFNGLITLMLGMLGEYTVRILQQISYQEIYNVKEIVKHEG